MKVLSELPNNDLLPTGSEEREVLGVRSIPGAILSSSQHMKTLNHNRIDMNIGG